MSSRHGRPVAGNHSTITRSSATCPSGNATYVFAADDPPRACAFGVDLIGITLLGS